MRFFVAGLAIAGLAACERPSEARMPVVVRPPPVIRLLAPSVFVTPSAARRGLVNAVVWVEPPQQGDPWPSVRCNDTALVRGEGAFYRGDVPVALEGHATTVACEALSAEGLGARDEHALQVEAARFTVSMTTEPGRWQATRCDDDDLLIVTGDGATRLAPDGRPRWAYAADGVALDGLCLLDGGALLRVITAGDPSVPNTQTASVVRLSPRGDAAVVPRPKGHWPLSLTSVEGIPHVVERTAAGPRMAPVEGGDGVPFEVKDQAPAPSGLVVEGATLTSPSGARITFTRPIFSAVAVRGGVVVLLNGSADRRVSPASVSLSLPALTPQAPEVQRQEITRWLDARATDEGVLALGALLRSPQEGALAYLTP